MTEVPDGDERRIRRAMRKAVRPAIDDLFATKWTVTTWADVLSY